MKNKLFIIFLIFFILIINFTSSCFAVDIIKDDITYPVPDFSNLPNVGNYTIFAVQFKANFNVNDLTYYYITYPLDYHLSFRSDSTIFLIDDNDKLVKLTNSSWYVAEDSDDSFSYRDYYTNLSTSFGPFPILLDSTIDIYSCSNLNGSNEGDLIKDKEILFQVAPAQVTIPAIQQVGEIPQVMEQVLKILIPIGLIVFSIGLVIYLTRLVISRVQ